jgi:hypothetical protein
LHDWQEARIQGVKSKLKYLTEVGGVQ